MPGILTEHLILSYTCVQSKDNDFRYDPYTKIRYLRNILSTYIHK